jgi:hypothetical protein
LGCEEEMRRGLVDEEEEGEWWGGSEERGRKGTTPRGWRRDMEAWRPS